METKHASMSAGGPSNRPQPRDLILEIPPHDPPHRPPTLKNERVIAQTPSEQDARFLLPALSTAYEDSINETVQRKALHRYMNIEVDQPSPVEVSQSDQHVPEKPMPDSDFRVVPLSPNSANVQEDEKSLFRARTSNDRYIFYSIERDSLSSPSLYDLLNCRFPEENGGKNVSEELLTTSCWWIDIFNPTDDEMRSLSKIFRIHPLTTEDIQAQESREKCEIFQNYMFISFRSFNHDYLSQSYLEAVNFYIIVFKDGVLTFHFKPLPHPHNVRRRIHQLKEVVRVTPEWINYALIDNITDSFAPLIQHAELEVDSIDDLVLVLTNSEQSDMLRRIGSCRKTVMQLLRLLGPKADVLRSLIKRYEDRMHELAHIVKTKPKQNILDGLIEEARVQHEVILYLGDIQDHILTMLQNVTHFDLTLGRAHRNYLGQVSIELSQAGNTTNEVINRLTFLATLVIPLNLVAGIFGMNVEVPGQNNTDLVWFFWIVCGMLVFVITMVAVGKRNNIL
ncbi:hypothetical protein F4703DRAFT_1840401 [Phycomyces blakesleeanus]